MTKFYCDRCKMECVKAPTAISARRNAELKTATNAIKLVSVGADLCEECMYLLGDWIFAVKK